MTLDNIWVAHGYSNDLFQANADAVKAARGFNIAADPAIFPDAAALARLEMLRDLDRKSGRVLNRVWTEIKLR